MVGMKTMVQSIYKMSCCEKAPSNMMAYTSREHGKVGYALLNFHQSVRNRAHFLRQDGIHINYFDFL